MASIKFVEEQDVPMLKVNHLPDYTRTDQHTAPLLPTLPTGAQSIPTAHIMHS